MINHVIAITAVLVVVLVVGAGLYNAGVEKGKEVALDILNELGLSAEEVDADE